MPKSTPITFATGDFLNRKPFCEKLERFLLVENDFVDGSLVVALNAGFGSGKTTFLQMWKTDLEQRRDNGDFAPMPVLLNAWENDFCGDPLLSVLTSLIEAVSNYGGEKGPDNANKLKEAAKDIGWFTMGLLNGVASKIGVDAMKAGKDKRGHSVILVIDRRRYGQEEISYILDFSTKSGQKKWHYYEKFARWSMRQAFSLQGVFQHLTQGVTLG